MTRILGKGLTAQAIKDKFTDVKLYDDNDFLTYDKNSNDFTIVSPGIPPSNFMVQNSNNIISEYDFFSKDMPYSIWISGTNGKTTTTQMCQLLLQNYDSQCGGNIGTPLASMDISKKIWILETSSFTMHYTKIAKPNIYILLPISEDHISWHGSFDEYKKAKLKPLDKMREGEIAIVPEEFKDYKTDASLITYSSSDCLCNEFGINKDKINFNEPFLLDAIMALAMTKILFDELDYDLINSFKVDCHKVEEFRDNKNRLWVDDSKATNCDATINALKAYENKKIHLILGGDDKGANLEPLFEKLQNINVTIYAIGSNEQRLEILAQNYNLALYTLKILKNAVIQIDKVHDKNSVAILSPAAASLDQFTSYKNRGEEFKKEVLHLS